jgi:solute carrier family 34 (sodium-dependent phosphate cotransporter)
VPTTLLNKNQILGITKQKPLASRFVLIILSLVLFLFALNLMVASLSDYASNFEKNILSYALDPFVGLFIGLLFTAIIQSSSTTSTMVVAMVATGTISIGEAIPIIMGANIGTTLTSTIVALGFISDKRAFRKAVSAGVIHDFYNIILVLILFPLEYYYSFLSRLSLGINGLIVGEAAFDSGNTVSGVMDFGVSNAIIDLINSNLVSVLLSFALLFLSIKLLTNVIKKTVIGDSKNRLRKFVFNRPFKSFGWGVLITSAIQSSSVATSLLVPLVATEKVRLRNAFPFIIGANLGTTITALIAASFNSEAAMNIALAHLIFNLFGAILFMSTSFLRSGLVNFIKKFSIVLTRKRVVGLTYIIVTFFLLPFILISIHKAIVKKEEAKKLENSELVTDVKLTSKVLKVNFKGLNTE